MARGAVFGSGLVEQNGFALHLAHQFVTRVTAHVAMRALQRESGSSVVIERGRFPLEAVVTVRAGRVLAFCKLPAVHVLVTSFTGCGRGFEVRVNQLRAHVLRLVAVDTSRGAVGSEERERSLGMIEARQFPPGLGRVASFASDWSSVGSHLQHAFLELAFVRISMATCAREILPVIDRRWFWFKVCGLLVAVAARNRDVSVGEHEMGFFMTGEREGRRLVAFEVVAAVASIEIRRSRELPGMLVAVAVGTALELDFE